MLLQAYHNLGRRSLRYVDVTSAYVLPQDDQPRAPTRFLQILWKIEQLFDELHRQDCSALIPNSEGLMNWTYDGSDSSTPHLCSQ